MARVFVFAFDRGEAAQVRRIRAFVALGHEVRVAAFARQNMRAQKDLGLPVIELGRVENRRLLRRLGSIAGAVARMLPRLGGLRNSDVIVARNFDLLLVAWLCRALAGARGRLVYECLDIHDAFLRKDGVGRAMRAAERAMLRRIDLLITSSPGFVENYFRPVQGFDGPIALLENKLWFDGPDLPRPATPRSSTGRPWVVGWVGSIRCAPSLRILTELADLMGGKVEIRVHGNVHRHALPGFDEAIRSRPNVGYYGEYTYPDDLCTIYGGCDVVWAQDLWQGTGNSQWLLPNRIYEASWFGCPSIAVEGTQTAATIRGRQLGFVIPSADAGALRSLLDSLTPAEVGRVGAGLLARPAAEFRLAPDEIEALLSPVLPSARREGPAAAAPGAPLAT